MRSRLVPFLAVLFVLFLIFQEPANTGAVAGDFAGFLGEFIAAVAEFLSGLLGDTNDGALS